MYKLIRNPFGEPNVVMRLADYTSIPFSLDNTDYQAYLKFLAEGGQPLPADEDGQAAE